MFNIGDRISGVEYNRAGEQVAVVGTYVATTNDPEEMIQDVIIRTADGRIVYIDEQEARYMPTPLNADEVAAFNRGELDMDADLYDRLYAYYTDPARGSDGMPYGTAKARDGDPHNWIERQLERDLAN